MSVSQGFPPAIKEKPEIRTDVPPMDEWARLGVVSRQFELPARIRREVILHRSGVWIITECRGAGFRFDYL